MPQNKLLIICGSTASGKSYLAHQLAKVHNGEVINSDSMQIYQQLPIITASPPEIHRREIPYHLYNFLSIEQEFSVIKYVNCALEKIIEVTAKGKLPIIIGGTGLYINSLIFGYNEIPKISAEIRQYVRDLHLNIGQIEFFNRLKELDILAGQKLHQHDTQRVIRAFEVFMQTGKSIFHFHACHPPPILLGFDYKVIFLHPERKFLYQTCNDRLKALFNAGAIEEVELMIKNLPDSYLHTSAGKTIGVREITSYLKGKITLEEAINLAQIKTRQYAKRQITWFKNQIDNKITLEYSDKLEFEQIINSLIQSLPF
jgi:tRNA dimethylallyltransferase